MEQVSSQLRDILARECPEVHWQTTRVEVTKGWGDICNVDIQIAQPSMRQRDLEDKIRNVVDAHMRDTQSRHAVYVQWGV